MIGQQQSEVAEMTHKWAHLAKPPYKFLGCTESKFQAVPGDPNCPIQPGTCCDYCWQGIMIVCHFRGSDGVEFKVGVDCAKKSGDVRVIAAAQKVTRAKASVARAKKAVSDASKLADLRANEAVRAFLESQPHPHAWRAQQGATLGDYYAFVFASCGASGTARYLKELMGRLDAAGIEH